MTGDQTNRSAERSNKTLPRHLSRLGSVQALYQMDMSGADVSDVVEQFAEFRFVSDAEYGEDDAAGNALAGGDVAFFKDIVEGVVRKQRDIDPMVDQQLATGWRLVRVDSTLRAILRAGVYELMDRPDVPARVVINEYINVGHSFFDGDEPRVINGVLNALAIRLRENEFPAGDTAKAI